LFDFFDEDVFRSTLISTRAQHHHRRRRRLRRRFERTSKSSSPRGGLGDETPGNARNQPPLGEREPRERERDFFV